MRCMRPAEELRGGRAWPSAAAASGCGAAGADTRMTGGRPRRVDPTRSVGVGLGGPDPGSEQGAPDPEELRCRARESRMRATQAMVLATTCGSCASEETMSSSTASTPPDTVAAVS